VKERCIGIGYQKIHLVEKMLKKHRLQPVRKPLFGHKNGSIKVIMGALIKKVIDTGTVFTGNNGPLIPSAKIKLLFVVFGCIHFARHAHRHEMATGALKFHPYSPSLPTLMVLGPEELRIHAYVPKLSSIWLFFKQYFEVGERLETGC